MTPSPSGPARPPAPPFLAALAVVVALAALVPVVYLGVRAGEGGWATIVETIWAGRTFRLLGRSLGLAGAVTAASAVIGVALAWLTVRCDLPGRRAWRVIAALPLAVPSYVAGFAYADTFPNLTGFWAAWLVLTTLSYP
ncbi:MAG: iron ABC transporter permease, partial [Acidimicrobiales bacterium]